MGKDQNGGAARRQHAMEHLDGRLEIGMGGAGGCSAWTEPALGYGAAFVSRGLGGHDRGEVAWEAIRAAYRPGS